MSQAQLIPHLSVVGHPNRGKSSLVATLTENDAVRIGPESGTTTRAAATAGQRGKRADTNSDDGGEGSGRAAAPKRKLVPAG